MRTKLGFLACLIALLGCHVAPLAARKLPAADGSTSTAPTAKNTPLAAASPGVQKLLPPQNANTVITGTVVVDANYLVSTGAGTIIAQGGGNIVAAGGGNIIAQGGGNIIAQGGGNIIAQGGGNIIAQGGGNIIAQGGGNIIAQGGGNVIPGAAAGIDATQGGAIIASGGGNIVAAGGGNIVAAGGGNIVAAGGGNIVAAGGGNIIAQGGGNAIAPGGGGYELLNRSGFGVLADAQASTSANASTAPIAGNLAANPLGTVLSATGMLVSAVSLRTHKYVPLGVNKDGKPVYAVYSNASGSYKVYVPQTEVQNILLVANPPGLQDERTIYNVVSTPTLPDTVAVDEDSALVGRYLRRIAREQINFMLTDPSLAQDRQKEPTIVDPNMDAATKALLLGVLKEIATALNEAHLTAAQVPPMAVRLADVAIANVALDTPISSTNTAWKDAPNVPAIKQLALILGKLRAEAGRRMATDPKYFDRQPYLLAVNADRLAKHLLPLEIRRPADFSEFVVTAYAGADGTRFNQLGPVLDTLGFNEKLTDGSNAVVTQISACSSSLATALLAVLGLNEDARNQFLNVIKTGATPI
jgi:hypothetical protein